MSVTATTVAIKEGVTIALKVSQKCIEAILNPEKTAETVLITILAFVSPIIIVVILLCGTTSAVQGYVFGNMNEFYESDLGTKIDKANTRFKNRMMVDMVALAIADFDLGDQIYVEDEEEDDDTKEKDDGDKKEEKEEISQDEKISLLATKHVTLRTSCPSLAYTLSYINHADDIGSKWGNIFHLDDTGEEDATKEEESISTKQIREFYESISSIKKATYIDVNGTECTDYYVVVLSPEEVAQLYWPEDTTTSQMFLVSYENYKKFLGISDSDLLYHYRDVKLNVPQYYQGDYEHVKYGRGTIKSSGCAPTAIAMVVSYQLNRRITPEDVVAFTGNTYYNWGEKGGSNWTIFPACAAHYGCGYLQTKDIQTVIDEVSAGNPVIASMDPGHFTKGRHFIVIVGMTSSGELIINDPNKDNFDKYGSTVPADWVWNEGKQYFVYKK